MLTYKKDTVKPVIDETEHYDLTWPVVLRHLAESAILLEWKAGKPRESLALFIKTAILERVERIYKKHGKAVPSVTFRRRGEKIQR